jgi:hypothetical protein
MSGFSCGSININMVRTRGCNHHRYRPPPWEPNLPPADDRAAAAVADSAKDAREEECRNPAVRRVRRKLWHIPSHQWFHCGGKEQYQMEEESEEEEDEDEDDEEERKSEGGRDEPEEVRQPSIAAAAAAHPPVPALRCPPLYADVLHCIFSFLPAASLCAASSVDRSWRAAVLSQPCSELAVQFQMSDPDQLLLLLQSSVARRHMSALRVTKELRGTELLLLATVFPALHILQCDWLTIPRWSPLTWPSQLRRLDLALDSFSGKRVTATFDSISRLTVLEQLYVSFPLSSSVSWAALSRCTTLRSLALNWDPDHRCTKKQLDAFREMPFLRMFRMTNSLDSSSDLCHLLRPLLPHPLQLHQLPLLHLDDAAAAALADLPMLRALRFISVSVTDFSFVRRLPHLRSLTVDADTPSNWAVDQFVAAAAAGHFAHVTDVNMEGHTEEDVQRLEASLAVGRR